jgi:peroxiredoxin
VLLPAAAWLFWVLGLTLGFALVGSGSGAAHRPGGAPPVGALRTAAGRAVPLPDPDGRLVHLQFRRWAGCPVCNVHLRRFAARAGELGAAGVREVVVFHSSAADVSELHAGLPFDVVADPTKRLYAAFGARSSPLFLAHPKAAWAWLRGVLSRRFTLKATNGPFALPADFLIDPAGRFVAVKYGRHADDGWTVDEVLALAGASSAASRRPVPPS